ncbi:MAG: hypothetical protein JWS12_236 [Candidatus Saccharibacteria bacterium]|nr:hypothetical protein [Candidatus Saccharibacteria bacterium]
MDKLNKNQTGFSAVEGLLIATTVGVIGFVGWYVYQSRNKTNTSYNNVANNQNATTTKPSAATKPAATTPAVDVYAGWKTYTNSTYGFSYKYPTTWTTSDEVSSSAAETNGSATRQQFGTGLKLVGGAKYSNTVVVEVLDEKLATATSFYDGYYAQSSLNKVTKTTNKLKGKSSTQYAVTNSGIDSKLYLFAIGNKTYSFGSVNEELNVKAAADYWTTFTKAFDSLTIN